MNGVPTIEEIHLNPDRKRVLGYPVVSLDEVAEVIGIFPRMYDTCILRDGKVDMRTFLYGLPVLTEPEALMLEKALDLMQRHILDSRRARL